MLNNRPDPVANVLENCCVFQNREDALAGAATLKKLGLIKAVDWPQRVSRRCVPLLTLLFTAEPALLVSLQSG